MKCPVIKKYYQTDSAFIERKLPVPGQIVKKIGENVTSYDKLGFASVVKESEEVLYKGKVVVKEKDRVYPGDTVAVSKQLVVRKKEYKTTISGYINKIDAEKNLITISGVSANYNLISGVSGQIIDIMDNKSVLIKTEAVVVKGIAGCGAEIAGELVYLDEETPDEESITEKVNGKIIIANKADLGAISKARTLGALGFVLGSCEYSEYKRFVTEDFSVLVLEAFGGVAIAKPLLDYFKKMDAKFGAVRTYENMLILPGENISSFVKDTSDMILEKQVNKGEMVQIFNKEHFGKTGEIVDIKGTNIIVKLPETQVEVAGESVGVLV